MVGLKNILEKTTISTHMKPLTLARTTFLMGLPLAILLPLGAQQRLVDFAAGDNFAIQAGRAQLVREQLPSVVPETEPALTGENSPFEVRLRDGSELDGTLEDINAESIVFRPLWSESSLTLPHSQLRNLYRDTRLPKTPPPPSLFEFRNGSSLRGRLLGWESNQVQMISSWGQPLSIPQEAVARIGQELEPLTMRSSYYQRNNRSPQAFGERLLLRSPRNYWATRMDHFPSSFMIEARYRVPKNPQNMRISLQLLGQKHPQSSQNALYLQLASDNITGRWPNPKGKNRRLQNWQAKDQKKLLDREVQLVRVYINLQNQEIVLCVNGSEVKRWKAERWLKDYKQEEGGYIQTNGHIQNGAVFLEQLSIMPWEGETLESRLSKRDDSKHLLLLQDGSTLQGEPKGMNQEELRFELASGAGQRSVSFEDLRYWYPPRATLSSNEPPLATQTLYLAPYGERLEVTAPTVKDGTLTGTWTKLGVTVSLPLRNLILMNFSEPGGDS